MNSAAGSHSQRIRQLGTVLLLGALAAATFYLTGAEDVRPEATSTSIRHNTLDAVIPEIRLGFAEELAEGSRLVAERRRARAEPHLQRAIELNPTDAEAHYQLGLCAMGLGEFERAEEQLDIAIEQDSGNALYALGMAELIGARLSENPNPLTQLSLVARGKRMIDLAIELDGKLLDARLARILFCLAAPKLLGGGIERAHEEVNAIRAVDEAIGLFAEGWLAEQDGSWSEAESLHKQSIGLNADYPRVRHRLGYLLLGQNRNREALEQFEAYRRIDSRNPHAQEGLGRCFLAMDRHEDAHDRFSAALDIEPDFATARFGLAESLSGLNRIEAARLEYQAYLTAVSEEESERSARAREWLDQHPSIQ